MNKQELIEKYEYLNHDCFRRVDTSEVLKDLKQLDEPQKVTVPQFVADWIEYCKEHNFTLFGCLDPANGFESLAGETFEGDVRKCIRWCRKESNNFARAWLDGYTVEKEPKYTVKLKNTDDYLVKTNNDDYRFYNNIYTNRRKHTRKEIENAGFGWVFSCEGVEVEEVGK